MKNKISDYYNQNPQMEWDRLTETFYRKLEFETVTHFLQKYLPATGKILDLGGGPGRYSLLLAKKGYRMTLIDIAEGNIQFANQKMIAENIVSNFDALITGHEKSLSRFDDAFFDAVLSMGPMYHLLTPEEHLFCMRECSRVLKNQGILFVTGYPRMSYIRDTIRSGDFTRMNNLNFPVMEEVMNHGFSRHSGYLGTYFCGIEEFRGWFGKASFEIMDIVSTHGIASFLNEQVNAIGENTRAWEALVKLVIDSANDPLALSHAEYWLGIGRKK